jgi:hypothetical protein
MYRVEKKLIICAATLVLTKLDRCKEKVQKWLNYSQILDFWGLSLVCLANICQRRASSYKNSLPASLFN